MAWIELHQSLRHHPKTKALARALCVDRAAAVGHVCCLWLYALEFAEDGDLSRFDPQDLADEMFYKGKADVKAALAAAGFLDADGTLHDWRTYVGKLLDKRAADAERKRTARAQSKGSPKDVLRTARGQAKDDTADGSKDGAETARVTVPYRTEPEQITAAAVPPAALKSATENGNGNGNGSLAQSRKDAKNGEERQGLGNGNGAGKAAEAPAGYGTPAPADKPKPTATVNQEPGTKNQKPAAPLATQAPASQEDAESWKRWGYCAEALRRQGWLDEMEIRQLLHECRRWWRDERKQVPGDGWFHEFLGNVFHSKSLNDGGQQMRQKVGFVLSRVKNGYKPKEHHQTTGERAFNHVVANLESPEVKARVDELTRVLCASWTLQQSQAGTNPNTYHVQRAKETGRLSQTTHD